jgi:hypothetical protein
MNNKKHNISSYFIRVSVLFLYVSFFIVQLFFNFDIANHSNANTFLSFNKSAAYQSLSILKANKEKGKKQTIRLNKRFEPKAIPAYNIIIEKPSLCYLETKPFVSNSFVVVHAPFLLSQSFRGPPVVA